MLVRRVADAESLAQCREIRRIVFVLEQSVAEDEEWDGLDDQCTHFVAELDGGPVGCARLLVTADGRAKAQRVAVLREHRRRGIGAALMAALEAEAARGSHAEVILGAQLQALAFYERLGYRAYGEEFMDAGIPHRMMRKPLGAVR